MARFSAGFFLDYTMRKLYKLAKRWLPILTGVVTVIKFVLDLIDRLLK